MSGDLSSMSDAELMAILGQTSTGQSAKTEAAPTADMSGMSNEDLMKMVGKPDQMTGMAREVALPASNVAKGLVSLAGLPGDVARGVGYVGGQQAASSLAGNPFPPGVAGTPQAGWPTNAGELLPQGNQVMQGRQPVTPPSGHNPFDSESLLGLTQKAGITDRPDLTPTGMREQLEAAGAQGVGAALPALLSGGVTAAPTLGRAAMQGGKALMQGAAGGIGGELGGDLGGALGGTPGQLIGTGLGAVAGGRLAPGGKAAGSFFPTKMDQETRQLAEAAQQHGFDISVGQASNNKFVKYLDSWAQRMPFSGYGGKQARDQETFNRGLAKSFGEDAPKITPEVIDNAYKRIGGVMDDVAQRTTAPFDSQLQADLTKVSQLAQTAGLQEGQASAIQKQIDNLWHTAVQNGGAIPGQIYQNLTKRGEALDLLQGNRSTTAGQLGGQIRDALDSALTRGATAEDVAALREARTQYKALKTVEPLTMRADASGGSTPSTGDISPASLLSRVKQQYSRAPRQDLGEIPLNDLAKIGQRFLKEPPSSGTAERLTVGHLMHTMGGAVAPILGAEAAHGAGAPLHILIPSAAAGLAMPRVLGSVMRQPVLPTTYAPFGFGALGGYPQMVKGGER